MTKTNLMLSLVLAVSVLVGQAGIVLAAPSLQEADLIAGTVQSITLETDANTGITTVIVEVIANSRVHQTVRISQRTAEQLGLIMFDGDGSPVINHSALGKQARIELATVIPKQPQDRHPVGDALATFFFERLDTENEATYSAIMDAHNEGTSFGAIAQALWLTQQIPEDSLPEIGDSLAIFKALLVAKESGDYSSFTFVDETGTTIIPKNWGQLKKALQEHRKIGKSLDTTLDQNSGNDKNKKDKKDNKNKTDKSNPGAGHDKDKQNDK